MNVWIVLYSAALLSLERICYIWIWRAPHVFRAACASPVDALRFLFYVFKVLQVGVFVSWWYVFGHGRLWPPDAGPLAIAVGSVSILFGQLLNLGVFYRLGDVGVFYGNRFGYAVPRCQEFPFSLFDHPQYVGTLLSIWGVFVVMRFPHDDWWVLPAIETVYYLIGARLED